MKRLTAPTAMAAALAIFAVMFASNAAAQGLVDPQRTILTFDGPVEVPGTVLPPGTYVFRVAQTGGRDVVQVFKEEDEREILAQFHFVEANRPDGEVTGETEVKFAGNGDQETGGVPAIQYWFYPGRRVGKEFVYPDDQARQIAERGGTVRSGDAPVGTSGSDDRPVGTSGGGERQDDPRQNDPGEVQRHDQPDADRPNQ